MARGPWRRPLLLGLASTVLAAACAGSGDGDGAEEPAASTVPATTASDVVAPLEEDSSETGPEFEDGPLAEVCPATIVVQTESSPHPRHGPLYALLASGPTIDATGQVVSGPLRRVAGQIEDVTLEVRSGGPAVEFRSPLELQAAASADAPIHLAEVAFSELAVAGQSAVGVVALGGGNDDMVMWDPVTYPAVATIADLGSAEVEVRHLVGEPFAEFLVATDQLDVDRLTERGGPEIAGFIATGGQVARQGDAIVDPPLLASIPQWGREVRFQSGSEVGWNDVDRLLAAGGALSDACLGRLVPIIQSAIGAYVADAGPVNELLSELRRRFNPIDRIGASVLDAAVSDAVADGRWSDGYDGADGVVDLDRLDAFAGQLADALGVELRATEEAVTDAFLVADPD